MAHDHSTTSDTDYQDRAWELIDKIKFALFSTWTGARQAQWPLTAIPDRDAGRIEFLVSAASDRYAHLAEYPAVTLGFADAGASKYVVVNGEARLTDDRARIRELWSPFAQAWWDSAEDPDIRLLVVTPERAELWDAPNKLVATAVMLGAAVTGAKPAMGDHGVTRL